MRQRMWILSLLSVVSLTFLLGAGASLIIGCSPQSEAIKVIEPKTLKTRYGSTMDLVSFAQKLSTSRNLSVARQLSSGEVFENCGGLNSDNTLSIKLSPLEASKNKFIVTVRLKSGYQFENPQNENLPGIWLSQPQTYLKKTEVFWPENLPSYESELTLDEYLNKMNYLSIEEKLTPGTLFRNVANLNHDVVQQVLLSKINDTQFKLRLWLKPGYEFSRMNSISFQYSTYWESEPITYQRTLAKPDVRFDDLSQSEAERKRLIFVESPKANRLVEINHNASQYVNEANAKDLTQKLKTGYLFENAGGLSLENVQAIELSALAPCSIKVEVYLKDGYSFSREREDSRYVVEIACRRISQVTTQPQRPIPVQPSAKPSSSPQQKPQSSIQQPPAQKSQSSPSQTTSPIQQPLTPKTASPIQPRSAKQSESLNQSSAHATPPQTNPLTQPSAVKRPDVLRREPEAQKPQSSPIQQSSSQTISPTQKPQSSPSRISSPTQQPKSPTQPSSAKQSESLNQSSAHATAPQTNPSTQPATEPRDLRKGSILIGIPEYLDSYESEYTMDEYISLMNSKTLDEKLTPPLLFKKLGKGMSKETVEKIWLGRYNQNSFRIYTNLKAGYLFTNSTPTQPWSYHGSFIYEYKQIPKRVMEQPQNKVTQLSLVKAPKENSQFVSSVPLKKFKEEFDLKSIEEKINLRGLFQNKGGLTKESVKSIELALFRHKRFQIRVWLNAGYVFDGSYTTFSKNSNYWESDVVYFNGPTLIGRPQMSSGQKLSSHKRLADYVADFNSKIPLWLQHEIASQFVKDIAKERLKAIELIPSNDGKSAMFKLTLDPKYVFSDQGEVTWVSEQIPHINLADQK